MPKKAHSSTKSIFKHLYSSHKHRLLKELDQQLQGRGDLAVIFTPNLEQLSLASSNKEFAQSLGSADYLLPDGMGLVWGSRFLSHFGNFQKAQERISGREVVVEIITKIENQPILIVGGKNYQDLANSKQLPNFQQPPVYQLKLTQFPNQNQIYWTPGFESASSISAQEDTDLLRVIKDLKPKVVFVALGAPAQELWTAKYRSDLEQAGVKIAMAVGGSFDVLLGKLQQPPSWMEQAGLEWLYRLMQEPWRWRRQLQLFVAMKLIIQLALQDDLE
jgi:N-acetylglucosaminyldiphosphoundecaprenol N-acetyl-beta-D-mannosaminyltransferase